jgi:hypothetical protein
MDDKPACSGTLLSIARAGFKNRLMASGLLLQPLKPRFYKARDGAADERIVLETRFTQRYAWAKRTSSSGWVLAAVLMILIAPSAAQVRGEYSPGSTLAGAGTVSDPGFSYSNQIWYNSSDRLYGPKGNAIAIPGQLAVLTENNSVVYVPKFRLLHAKVEFMLCLAFANGRLDARNPFNGDKVAVGAVGLTDTNFVPLELGWSLKRVDLQTGISVYAPTGRYVPHAANNLSSGFWTAGWQAGTTIYLTKNKATQASVYNYYAWNTVQQGTGIRAGQNDSVDYSVTHTFALGHSGRWSLLAGPAGYGQWRTTNNQGQPPAIALLNYGVDAVGFTTNLTSPYKGLYAGVSTLFEYAARNTYEGRTNVITAGLSF